MFKKRRPWAAALVGALLSPVIGMLSLGQGRKALVYLAFYIAFVVFLTMPAGVRGFDLDYGFHAQVGSIAFALIGAVHCYIVAVGLDNQPPQKWFSRWYWIAPIILVAIALIFAFRSLLWEPFTVSSGSMEPTLHKKTLFFANKFAYGYSAASFGLNPGTGSGRSWMALPERGDIVVFRAQEGVVFVKRVVGLPGDRVQINAGLLHINTRPVVREENGTANLSIHKDVRRFNKYIETLPNGKSYPILEENDDGVLDNTSEYIVPQNHVFVLGDNRDMSLDSRFPNFGYVPIENLVGRVSR